jgi:hypothetical protein
MKDLILLVTTFIITYILFLIYSLLVLSPLVIMIKFLILASN